MLIRVVSGRETPFDSDIRRSKGEPILMSGYFRLLIVAATLSLTTACAVSEGGPAEFSFERITISNPFTPSDERLR